MTMATTVTVRWDNGQPCSGVRVRLWLDREGNEERYTDSHGEADFDYGPGSGTLYCDGQEVRSGYLDNRMTVTCRQSGPYEYCG
jgi:hypothetical protein